MRSTTILAISIASALFSFFANAQELKHATARIKATRWDVGSVREDGSYERSFSSYTNLERITSDPVLNKVAAQLNLSEKWTLPTDAAVAALKEKLSVTPYLNTSIISIRASGLDDAEAAAIANEVAYAFKNLIDEENRIAQKAAQKEADAAVKKQETIVEQLKQELKDFDNKNGATRLRSETDESLNTLRLEQFKRDHKNAQEYLFKQEARLKQLNEAKAKSMDDVLALSQDKFLERMLKEIKRLETELDEKSTFYEKNHPEIRQRQAALDELNEKAEQACAGILKGVHAQCTVAKAKLEALSEAIEIIEQPAAITPEQEKILADYESMLASLKTEKETLSQLKRKAATVQFSLSKCTVDIISLAERPKPPSEFEKASRAAALKEAKDAIQPKFHHATAKISIEEHKDQLPEESITRDPYFIRTEILLITSKPVLSKVVHKLDLTEKWKIGDAKPSPNEAYTLLLRKLRVLQIGTTHVIGITASSEDAAEAVTLANEVALTYQELISEYTRKEQQQAREALKNELKKQEDKVKQAELKYQELREQNGLPETPVGRSKEETMELEQNLIQTQVELRVMQSRLKQLEAKKNLPLLEQAAAIPTRTIDKLRSNIESASLKLKKIPTSAPDFKAEQDAIEAWTKQLKTAVDEYLLQLHADCAAKKATYDALHKKLDHHVSREDMIKINRAKRNIEFEKKMLQAMNTRAEEELQKEKPPRKTVQIISLAEGVQTTDTETP